MTWVFITILAYFLLAATSIIDKFLLSGPRLKPQTYAFYIAVLSVLVFLLIPFGVEVPNAVIITIASLSGALWIFALLSLFEALRRSEVSRVIPAIGGMLPLFTLGLSYLFAFLQRQEIGSFTSLKIISFLFLIAGTVLINAKKGQFITKSSLGLAALTGFLFALSFTTTKIVYLEQPFISGLFWIRLIGIPVACLFLFSKEVRKEIFSKKTGENIKGPATMPVSEQAKPMPKKPKILILFLLGQLLGGLAVILQNLAIFLVPAMHLAFINALEGVRYAFLLVFTCFISVKFPQFLEERFTLPILFQKVFAIVLIVIGLFLLNIS
jgi:drug/metabolite transporter (DMT)-like permease